MKEALFYFNQRFKDKIKQYAEEKGDVLSDENKAAMIASAANETFKKYPHIKDKIGLIARYMDPDAYLVNEFLTKAKSGPSNRP